MLTLGIETTDRRLDVALARAGGVEAQLSLQAGRQHGRRLVPAVQSLLDEAGFEVDDIEAVAVDTGPGSYTGIRIGLTTARAFAYARGLPLVGVTGLKALAAARQPFPGWLAPTMDARHGRVYAALYPGDLLAGPPAAEIRSPAAWEVEAWRAVLSELQEPVLVVGSGAVRHQPAWRSAGRHVAAVPGEPGAGVIAQLAARHLEAGGDGDPLQVEAAYLRLPAPERQRREQGDGRGA